jgi:hypothetical protein
MAAKDILGAAATGPNAAAATAGLGLNCTIIRIGSAIASPYERERT